MTAENDISEGSVRTPPTDFGVFVERLASVVAEKVRPGSESSSGEPPDGANAFVEKVLSKAGRSFTALLDLGGDDRRRLVKLVGFLDKKPSRGPRRLYFTDTLDTGVDISGEILFYQAVEPREEYGDGLPRDAIWVAADIDLTYWSKRPCKCRGPVGGDGFPPVYRPII